MKYLIPILIAFVLLIPTPSSATELQSKIPTFTIQSVVKDTSVTIETKDFPAGDTFVVTMGKMGTRGVNGIKVGEQKSGEGGTFTATYKIPDALKGEYQIAIRLQSPTSGYYAYNWFYNNTTAAQDGDVAAGEDTAGKSSPSLPAGTIPTFSIESVVRGDTVTIKTKDFPAGDTFVVTMGKMGTRGVNGIKVGEQKSGEGGTFTATYKIPDALKGEYQIAIRLQSPTSGYYAYNWFYNNTTK